jgi:hypothetical protein
MRRANKPDTSTPNDTTPNASAQHEASQTTSNRRRITKEKSRKERRGMNGGDVGRRWEQRMKRWGLSARRQRRGKSIMDMARKGGHRGEVAADTAQEEEEQQEDSVASEHQNERGEK